MEECIIYDALAMKELKEPSFKHINLVFKIIVTFTS